MTVKEWLRSAAELLRDTGCPDPEIDSRWIAEDLLGMTPTQLRFEGESDVPEDRMAALDGALERRSHGEPVQYILGSADFMGMKFKVDPRVLIPRPETETLVENAVILLREHRNAKVLDLCTGSGAIGISVKQLVDDADVTLSDLSRDALEVAKSNARLLDTDVTFCHGDLYKAVGGKRFDMILTNPPYIPTAELKELQREVLREPAMALDGGADGLDLYRRIMEGATAHLNAGGQMLLEVGIGEAEAVLALGKEHIDCAEGRIIRDLSGIERIVYIRSK